MNMENRSAWPTFLRQPVSTESSADTCGQTSTDRQETWDHAQRLYEIGEFGAAAQLFTQLASPEYQSRVELDREVING